MYKPVLDPCCGSRKFYFNKDAPFVLYGDIRDETYVQCDGRKLVVHPDVKLDVTKLDFRDEIFSLVVYDPPHLQWAGHDSFIRQAYGVLPRNEPMEYIVRGFNECWRVLRPEGTLIFKWNTCQIPIAELLKMLPEKPLFGNRRPTGHGGQQSFWFVFFKFPKSRAYVSERQEELDLRM